MAKTAEKWGKIDDKNQVLLLGPIVHTWLSNQAGGAGGGLYSTTRTSKQLATHPATQPGRQPRKLWRKLYTWDKIAAQPQELFRSGACFHLLGQVCLIVCCGGNQPGWRYSIEGLVHCRCVTESYQSLFSRRHCVQLHWLVGPKSHLQTNLILTSPNLVRRSHNSKNNSHPT